MENIARENSPSMTGMGGNSEGIMNTAFSSAHSGASSAGAVHEAARKARPAIDRVAAAAHQAVDAAADAAVPAADWLAEQGETLNATQKKLIADLTAYVSANPLKSIGIAVVGGFLLARIIR